MPKAKAASSSRAQVSAFGATAFGAADNSPRNTSTFGTSFSAVPASQLSYVYEPPDLNTISDPAVVVSWKNLQKRDSITKTKALDELLAHVAKVEENKQTLEEGFLEAWVVLYARSSIDNARQVRQRAHTLQGRIAAVLGKRIAKSLPSLIGAWLSGLHDNDKLVVRSTQDSLDVTFPTEDKRLGVWKVYHTSILEYCSNAILHEDIKTLSDERTTNKDDAEAKFSRTIGSAILTISCGLEVLDGDALHKKTDRYKEVLDSDKFWAFGDSSDSFLRQAVCKVTQVRLEKLGTTLDDLSLQKASKVLLGKVLRKDQAGSSFQFVELLAAFSKAHPTIWTSHFSSAKKTAPELLSQFLKKLPNSPSPGFWASLRGLLEHIPIEIICPPGQSAEATGPVSTLILSSFHEGLSKKENLRAASPEAWEVYIALIERYASSPRTEQASESLAQDFLSPLVRQYVLPEMDGTSWTIAGATTAQEDLCWKTMSAEIFLSPAASQSLVEAISSAAIEAMQTSLPEQSQGFQESQRRVGALFARWNGLKQRLVRAEVPTTLRGAIDEATLAELQAAMQLLKNRNGKPFGAALVIQSCVSRLPTTIMAYKDTKSDLVGFLAQYGHSFVGGPSTSQILDIFHLVDELDPSIQLYNRSLSEALQRESSPSKTATLQHFIGSGWPTDPSLSQKLSEEVLTDVREYEKGDTSRTTQLEAVLANKSTPEELTGSILAKLVSSLSIDELATPGLLTLTTATNKNQNAVQRFLASPSGSSLGPKLLLMSQSGKDAESRRLAADLGARARMLSSEANDEASVSALIKSVHEGLLNTSNASLTVDVLVGIASQIVRDTQDKASSSSQQLFLDHTAWRESLMPYVTSPPWPSLSVTNSLGGTVHWLANQIHGEESASKDPVSSLYDSSGHSIPLRVVQYSVKLLELPGWKQNLETAALESIVAQLAVFGEILSDNLSAPAAVPLWISDEPVEIVELLAQTRELVASIMIDKRPELRSISLTKILASSKGTDVQSYYAARAYVTIAHEMLDTDASAITTTEDDLLPILRKPSGSFDEAARFATMGQGSGNSKLVNSAVAELSRFDFRAKKDQGLYLMSLLNCLMLCPSFDDAAFNQQHRLVQFVKHVVNAIETDQALNAEIFQALTAMTPLIKDIFDNFWTELVHHLINCFESKASGHSILEPALRLLGRLQSLVKDEDTNDDLKDAWEEMRDQLSEALLRLLQRQSSLPDNNHQPRRIVNDLLSRRLDSLQLQTVATDTMYPVVASRSFVLQRSAFQILDQAIPAAQENITLETALIKDFVAKLPEKLMILISEAPSEVLNLAGSPSPPSALARYLFAWKLIFDHWGGASYQVQSNYVAAIKEGKHVQNLLDLIFEVCINSRTKPLDVSKLSFEEFGPDLDDEPERECQRSLCHLYLLSLKHVPSLVRTWWRDECPRSISRSVEEWTERYFSPLVVAAELAEVAAWYPKQESDTPLEIKISNRAREVSAMYPIDEQMSAIRITLPSNYPLSTITVDSLNRVGVDEKKWRAWLINAQGVMNFAPSSGGIGAVTDGLVGFRRNVVGTMKGHAECAICYSIVNADRQLPTKKCGTCKNAFHGTCLFRWFKSSGGSSCPLCRNAFNYG